MQRFRRARVLIAAVAGAMASVALLAAEPPEGEGPSPQPAESRQAPAAPPSVKVLHLKVAGDLDNGRLVTQFGEAVAGLAAEGVEILILEIGGNRWRTDVVCDMVKAARSAGLLADPAATTRRPEWIVWLNDPADARVGSGAATLGAIADRCFLGHKTEIVFEPGDDVREIAPLNAVPDWGAVEQEIQGAVWGRLQARGAEVLLAAALPTPRQPLWMISAGESSDRRGRLVATAPSSGTAATPLATPVVGRDEGAVRLRIDAAAAKGLGLAEGQAREVGQILAARRVLARPLVRRDIQSGLKAAKKQLYDNLSAADALRERIDKLLDEGERARGLDVARRRATAGKRGLPLADEALALVLDAESLFKDYPELLRLVPPGHTEVGLVEARTPLAWNSAFQSRRTALTELRNRAARLAE